MANDTPAMFGNMVYLVRLRLPWGRVSPPHLARTDLLLLTLLTVTLLGELTLCLWTLDRGFDITDEANALLLAMHPESFRIFVSATHWPTSFLWNLTGSLLLYRGLGLSLLLISSALLGLGTWRAARAFGLISRPDSTILLAVTLCAATVSLHWVTYGVSVFFTPLYNLIVIAASYTAMGLALWMATTRNILLIGLLSVLIGACLGVTFLCKFPAGIAVFALICAMLLLMGGFRPASLATVLLTAVGMSGSVLLIAWANGPLADVVANFKAGLQLYKTALPEPIMTRLMRNATELTQFAVRVLADFFVPIGLFAVYAVKERTDLAAMGLISLIFILITGGYLLADTDLMSSDGRLEAQIVSMAAVFCVGLTITSFRVRLSTKLWILLLALIGLPYAIAIGTANNYPAQVLISLAPWAACLTVLSARNGLTLQRRAFANAVCGIFALISSIQVSVSFFTGAYHLDKPLSQQSLPADLGDLGTISVDPETHDFIKAMETAKTECNVDRGAPFIGLYNMPGVALLLQARPISTTWLLEATQAEPWLRASEPDTVRRAVVGVDQLLDGSYPPIPLILQGFPRGYKFCGEGIFPYKSKKIQIWAPQ